LTGRADIELSKGGKIGIGVGAGILVLLCLFGAYFLPDWYQRHKAKRGKATDAPNAMMAYP